MKPLILLDVDGVLNLYPVVPGTGTHQTFPAWSEENQREYTMSVPNYLFDAIPELEKLADFAWCTTWNYDAPASLSPVLGFGADWPVVEVGNPEHVGFRETWKVTGVTKFLEAHEGRRVVWIDDQLFDDAADWAARMNSDLGTDIWLFSVNGAYGLTKAKIDELKELLTV